MARTTELRRAAYAAHSAKYRAANPALIKERQRRYYLAHAEERRAYTRKYQQANPGKKLAYDRAHRDRINARCRARYAANPSPNEKRRKWIEAYREKRSAISRAYQKRTPWVRIKTALNARIYDSLRTKGAAKCARTMELLGCDMAFFRAYMEARFKPGMTWDNNTRYGWHIDHRIPCCKFNLLDPAEQRKAFHYSNLQPMWWRDNLRKHDKMPEPHQGELL